MKRYYCEFTDFFSNATTNSLQRASIRHELPEALIDTLNCTTTSYHSPLSNRRRAPLAAVLDRAQDWAYAASWEASPNPITVCEPRTYGGYPAERTRYAPYRSTARPPFKARSRSLRCI